MMGMQWKSYRVQFGLEIMNFSGLPLVVRQTLDGHVFNHTRAANAPLAPSPAFQHFPLPRGVSHPMRRTVPIGSQPEWDSHKLG